MSEYTVVCADPPWRFGDKLPGKGRGAARHYETTSVDGICGMSLPPIADDALLFLWRVSSMVEEAYDVVDAWGFTPKSEIVWQKLTKNGKPWFGMGRYVRASHETAIVAVRGKGSKLITSHGERSTFAAPVPLNPDGTYRHSAKPEEFYDKVERMCAGPYVELFARRQRLARDESPECQWTCLGNEMPTPAPWPGIAALVAEVEAQSGREKPGSGIL